VTTTTPASRGDVDRVDGPDDAAPQEPGGSPPPAPPGPGDPGSPANPEAANVPKLLIGLVASVVIAWFVYNAFLAFAYHPEWFGDIKIVIGLLALVAGVGGAFAFFYFVNMFVEGLPGRVSRALMPYAFVAPGIALISLMLIYPTIQTINYAFANDESTEYVGFDNFATIFTGDLSEEFWLSITNNILWLLLVPSVTVVFGIAVAVLADKLSERGEKIAKSLIFLPMAISFVGASVIWGTKAGGVYKFDSAEEAPLGLLNAVWRIVGDPVNWLSTADLRLNSILMMVIVVWLQVGFAMILLSSAIKGVPEDTLEAARIDGAGEWAIFSKVVIPQIKGTIITVFITVVIMVLKVFDIVYVLTTGRDKSNVIANLFYDRLINFEQTGVASAIVVVLLAAITPILVYQVRHFRREEMGR
jgi:alpha-glucoside transport system permease protein